MTTKTTYLLVKVTHPENVSDEDVQNNVQNALFLFSNNTSVHKLRQGGTQDEFYIDYVDPWSAPDTIIEDGPKDDISIDVIEDDDEPEEGYVDSENIYNLPSIKQSIEEDRK